MTMVHKTDIIVILALVIPVSYKIKDYVRCVYRHINFQAVMLSSVQRQSYK